MPPKGYKNKSEYWNEWLESQRERHISEITTIEEWNKYFKPSPRTPKEPIEGKQANPTKETK